MFLRAIELAGFKTFASRTRFEFHGGLTAVVGPNGSGKSNLADAVRWVLAEPAGRGLRVRKSEDLIYSGGKGRPAAGYAEVLLTLDNQQGTLPIAFHEVVITRRLHRSGESEFFINGGRSRQRDVIDLLNRAGVAQSTYAVIGQGLIDAALSLRPEERRELIEEAADVRRHQGALDEARSRLASARANLTRIDDLLVDLVPRVEKLGKQAADAREHRAYADELAALMATLYAGQWAEAATAHAAAGDRLTVAESAATGARIRLQETSDRLTAARLAVQQRRDVLDRLTADLRAAEGAVDRAQNDVLLAVRTLERLRDDSVRLAADASDHRDRAAAEDRLTGESMALLATVRTDLATARAALRDRRTETARLEQAVNRQATSLTNDRRALARAESEMQSDQALAERLATDIAVLSETIQPPAIDDTLAPRLTAARAAAFEADAEAGRLSDQRRHLQDQITASESRLAAVRVEVSGSEATIADLERRLSTLARDVAAGDGLFPAVRAVLDRAGQIASSRGTVAVRALEGIVGPVAALIDVPAGYEQAIEAALGGHSQDIVVERWVDAEAAIAYLRQAGAGRATFLPLDTIRPGRAVDPPGMPGVHGTASGICTFETRYQAVVDRLLGGFVVVEDLSVARRCLNGNDRGRQFVTLAGDVVGGWGSVSGGGRPSQRGGLLRRRAEQASLVADREAAISQRQRLGDEQARLTESIATDRASETTLRERIGRQQQAAAEANQQVRVLEAALAEATARTEDASRAAQRRAAERATLTERRLKALAAIATLDQEVSRLEAAVAAGAEALAAADAAFLAVRGDDIELANKIAGLEGTERAAEASLSRQRSAAQRERELAQRTADRLSDTERLIADQQAIIDRQQAVARGGQDRTEALHRETETIAAAQRQAFDDEPVLIAAEDSAREGASAAADEAAMARRVREAAEEALLALQIRIEGDGLTVEALADAASPENLDEVQRRVTRLRSRLRSLPTVSYSVIDEYSEEAARLESLTRQACDLREAEVNVQKAIGALEAQIADQFERTFAAVNAEFARYFQRLFNGGTAQLGIGEEAGIDITAQPPGKRTQTLALLSGGERALTAAALIFALLRVNPIPFCVLDEVDAALDESNVSRFVEAVEELSSLTQFVVVTHNRVTMEAASAIYGLAVAPDASSKVVSVKLRAA